MPTYIYTIPHHTIPYGIMLASLLSLLNAPKRSQNALNAFKRFHNASRRSITLPNVPNFSLCLCFLTYYTTPYGIMLTITPYTPHKPYI